MLIKSALIIILMLVSVQNNFSQDNRFNEPIYPMLWVDLNKYMGLWYEIAKIPNSFQDQCAYGTTAEYILLEDGDVQIINKCYNKDGELEVAEGIAKICDNRYNSVLEVSFFSILGIRPFWGDYYIIGTDEWTKKDPDDDYAWAVVGTPDRRYGWILSRTATLSDENMEWIYEVLRKNRYNPDAFEMTKHKN